MVPVEFSRRPEILSAFSSLLDKLADRGFAEGGDHLSNAYARAETAFMELLQKIAKEVKIDLSGFDPRGRVYAPTGWANEQAAIQSLRSDAAAVLKGERTVKIEVTRGNL